MKTSFDLNDFKTRSLINQLGEKWLIFAQCALVLRQGYLKRARMDLGSEVQKSFFTSSSWLMVCRSRWNKRLDMVIIRHVKSLLLRRFSLAHSMWWFYHTWALTFEGKGLKTCLTKTICIDPPLFTVLVSYVFQYWQRISWRFRRHFLEFFEKFRIISNLFVCLWIFYVVGPI